MHHFIKPATRLCKQHNDLHYMGKHCAVFCNSKVKHTSVKYAFQRKYGNKSVTEGEVASNCYQRACGIMVNIL